MKLQTKPFYVALLLLPLLVMTGCTHRVAEAPMTQLQVREIQTRSFENKDAKSVLKEMLNVLQDDAFIVKHDNLELGLLAGEKDIDIENGWDRFFSRMQSNQQVGHPKNVVIEVSANVSQFGNDTKVRVNFQRKTLDNFGRVMRVTQVYDSSYYQEFFSKVHKGLFFQDEQI
jgi:hypothetical protein